MRLSTWFLPAILSVCVPAFTGCAADTSAPAADVESEDELVRRIPLTPLPSSSPLRQQVEEQSETWGDENIMNGRANVIVRKVGIQALGRLDQVGRVAFKDRVTDDEVAVKGLATTASPAEIAKEAARRIALDGFVYADSRENIRPIEASVNALVAALGPAADIASVLVEGKVVVPEAGDDAATWRASAFVFANRKTGDVLIFYARQGWI